MSFLLNLVLVLLSAGAIGWSVLLVRDDGGAAAGPTASATRTVTAERGDVTATVEAGGTLEATATASATFTDTGVITAIAVKVGDVVEKGRQLAEIDCAPAVRALALASADLDAANSAVTRAQAASADPGTASAAVTQADLAVDDARADVEACKLTAPMAGTVTAVNGTVGSTTSAQDAEKNGFVELADLSKLQVEADFAEADATALKIGQPAAVTWSALDTAEAGGEITAIDPTATTSDSVVTYGVTAGIGTVPADAKPGQSVTVTVTTGTATGVTTVNAAAVTLSGSAYSVTVRNSNGSTERRAVRVGLRGDDAYEIKSGLAVGEKVVLPVPATSTPAGRQQDFGGGQGGPP